MFRMGGRDDVNFQVLCDFTAHRQHGIARFWGFFDGRFTVNKTTERIKRGVYADLLIFCALKNSFILPCEILLHMILDESDQ